MFSLRSEALGQKMHYLCIFPKKSIKELKLFVKCLHPGHSRNECKVQGSRCVKCQGTHSTPACSKKKSRKRNDAPANAVSEQLQQISDNSGEFLRNTFVVNSSAFSEFEVTKDEVLLFHKEAEVLNLKSL